MRNVFLLFLFFLFPLGAGIYHSDVLIPKICSIRPMTRTRMTMSLLPMWRWTKNRYWNKIGNIQR